MYQSLEQGWISISCPCLETKNRFNPLLNVIFCNQFHMSFLFKQESHYSMLKSITCWYNGLHSNYSKLLEKKSCVINYNVELANY